MPFKNIFQTKYNSHWLAVLSFSFIAIILVIIVAYREFIDEQRKAMIEAENMTIMLEQQTRTTFEKIDLLLKHAEDVYLLNTQKSFDAEKISKLFVKIKQSVPEAEILAVSDAPGYLIANSNWFKNNGQDFKNEKVLIADRPYFQQQQFDLKKSVVISDPIVSRTTGNIVINISHKLPLKDGKFQGLICATLNLKYFSDFFLKVNFGKSLNANSIALFTPERLLLARSPFNKDQIGKIIKNALPFLDKLNSGILYGNYINVSAVDSVKRIYAYRMVSGLPYVLVIGKDYNSVLKSWWRYQGVSGILLVLFLCTIIISLAFYLKKLQESEDQKDHAIQSSKMSMLGEMAAGIAHEIINPLAIIKLHSASMVTAINAGKLDPEKVKNSALKIDNMCIRIDKIIRGLKSYTRDSSHDPKVPTSLQAMMDTAIELTSIRFKNNLVELKSSPCPATMIFCREAQISQVLINIMNNASDAVATLEEKWVSVDYKMLEKRIQIIITDSGKGIPRDVAAKLMTPFFTTKAINKGTGLGLSISKKIIEDHEGTLTLDTDCPNTRFIIELPADLISI